MGKKLGLDKSYNALKITLGKYPLTSIGKNSPSSAFMSRALKLNTPPLVNSKLLNVGKKVLGKTPVGKGLNLALNVGKALKKTLTSKTNIGVSSAIAGFEAKNQIDKNPKVFDISLKEMIYGKKTDKKMAGGMMQGYGAARTSGMGLEDQSLMPGKMVRASKGKMLSAKQKKIARMAPPPDKITGADFKAMKAKNGKMAKMNRGGGMDAGAAQGKVDRIRAAYNLAKKNKGEDRLTQADIKMAEKTLKAYENLKKNK